MTSDAEGCEEAIEVAEAYHLTLIMAVTAALDDDGAQTTFATEQLNKMNAKVEDAGVDSSGEWMRRDCLGQD